MEKNVISYHISQKVFFVDRIKLQRKCFTYCFKLQTLSGHMEITFNYSKGREQNIIRCQLSLTLKHCSVNMLYRYKSLAFMYGAGHLELSRTHTQYLKWLNLLIHMILLNILLFLIVPYFHLSIFTTGKITVYHFRLIETDHCFLRFFSHVGTLHS